MLVRSCLRRSSSACLAATAACLADGTSSAKHEQSQLRIGLARKGHGSATICLGGCTGQLRPLAAWPLPVLQPQQPADGTSSAKHNLSQLLAVRCFVSLKAHTKQLKLCAGQSLPAWQPWQPAWQTLANGSCPASTPADSAGSEKSSVVPGSGKWPTALQRTFVHSCGCLSWQLS